jgi:uncharacterized protein
VQYDAEPPGLDEGMAVFSVVPDTAHRRPGRGAHIHPDPTCFARAQRRRAFGKALRVTGVIDLAPLARLVEAWAGTPGDTVGGVTHPGQAR